MGYHLLQPVYTLAILNENFDHKTDKFYHHYGVVNFENSDEVIKGLEFVLVELAKFKSEKWSERKIAALWLKFLKEVGENMTSLPDDLAENEQIRKAAELCREGAFTPAELEVYEAYWDWVRTEKTLSEGSLAAGLEKGEAIGIEKGEAIGLEKGEAIGRIAEKENMVINSHQAGLPTETISTIARLTVEQIIEILKRHGLM